MAFVPRKKNALRFVFSMNPICFLGMIPQKIRGYRKGILLLFFMTLIS